MFVSAKFVSNAIIHTTEKCTILLIALDVNDKKKKKNSSQILCDSLAIVGIEYILCW